MTFAKLAAEAIYSASDDEAARQEDEESRYSEWLKFAIGAGLLTAGAAAVYLNRDALREALSGRVFDSRGKLDQILEKNIHTTAGGVGAATGLVSSFGPMRRSRILSGDMASYSDLPGLGRRLTEVGEGAAPESRRMQDLVGSGTWGQLIGLKPQEVASRIGNLLRSAAAEGGDVTPFGRLNRNIQDLYAGYDADLAPGRMIEGVRGQRLFDPSTAPIRGRTTQLFTPKTELKRVLANAEKIHHDAGSARTALRTALDSGSDWDTAWRGISPDQRVSLGLEADVARNTGAKPQAFKNGILLDRGFDLGPLASAVRSAQNVKPGHPVLRGLGRSFVGLGLGSALGAGTNAVMNWVQGD